VGLKLKYQFDEELIETYISSKDHTTLSS